MKADDDRNSRVALFQKREIRRTIYDDEWWFVIIDVIAALTDSPDPSGYWKKMRKRDRELVKALEGGDNLSPPFP
jgi:DNA-damage-inducible protein D